MADDERISERIQEGITESFAVKDIRGFSTKKSCNPSPHDAVYKLSRIAMNGDRHKLLEQNGIKTVEDFLCSYSKNPNDLREIMGKIPGQDWDKLISHPQRCKPRAGTYHNCIPERNVSHKHEPSRSNDSCYLKGHPQCNQTLHYGVEQLDVESSPQQISSTLNGPSSAASSQNVPKEFDSNAGQQVASVGSQILPVPSMDNNKSKERSSQHRHSLECKGTPEGNRVLAGNPSADGTLEGYLSMLETTLLEDEVRGDFDFSETSLGLSSVNEAHMSYGRRSPASEAGSVIYGGLSPASEVGSGSYGRHSPSPIRKAGSVSYAGLSPASEVGSIRKFSPSAIRKAGSSRFREEPRLEPVREAVTASYARTDFRLKTNSNRDEW